MKKILLIMMSFFCLVVLTNCNAVYRVYNDEDLNSMAISDFDFSSTLFFKVIDADTAMEVTGESYNNSGVIYGVKDGLYNIIFVPKLLSKEAFIVNYTPIYDVIEIYNLLQNLEDESGQLIFHDPSYC